jgi:energy-coupling factor transporter ATP-binding protein EcfA2
MTNLLAFIGSKGSGKTTLSKLLTPYDWKQTSFATPIKRMIATLLLDQGVSGNDVSSMLYGENKETPTPFLNYKTPRHAMQTLGSEWRDLIGRNLWLDIWKRTINLKFEKIIVDDSRFIHETNFVKSLGGKVILIQRQELNSFDLHISEQEFIKIKPDFIINNFWQPESMLDQLINHLPGVTNI